MWVLSAVCIAAELVTFLTLGNYGVEWRARLLFSSWMDEKDPMPFYSGELDD